MREVFEDVTLVSWRNERIERERKRGEERERKEKRHTRGLHTMVIISRQEERIKEERRRKNERGRKGREDDERKVQSPIQRGSQFVKQFPEKEAQLSQTV